MYTYAVTSKNSEGHTKRLTIDAKNVADYVEKEKAYKLKERYGEVVDFKELPYEE